MYQSIQGCFFRKVLIISVHQLNILCFLIFIYTCNSVNVKIRLHMHSHFDLRSIDRIFFIPHKWFYPICCSHFVNFIKKIFGIFCVIRVFHDIFLTGYDYFTFCPFTKNLCIYGCSSRFLCDNAKTIRCHHTFIAASPSYSITVSILIICILHRF